MNINDGAFYFTNGVGAANQAPNLQIGVAGLAGEGVVNVGDGIGAAGSALLNLRHLVSGADNVIAVSMNLGSSSGGSLSGKMVINADGLVEGDVRTLNGVSNPVIRIGQAATAAQVESSVLVNGGRFNVGGTMELGSENGAAGTRAKGSLTVTNGGRVEMGTGELAVGWNGDGKILVSNNGVFSRTLTAANRMDINLGREANGVGSITVESGGQFLVGGGDLGDFRIGRNGRGTVTINNGGLLEYGASNWIWVGNGTNANGYVQVNAGGTFRTTGSGNFNIGDIAASTGLVEVNGGNFHLLNNGGQLRIGQNGNGTFRQISGSTNVGSILMAENSGLAGFELQSGELNSRGQMFMGGGAPDSGGNGTATATQSGGVFTLNGSMVVGLAAGHSASYTMTGGELRHTGSDFTVGESGIGTLTIGAGATVNDTSAGGFVVGRNNGSAGFLTVDGLLTRSSGAVRIGNGDLAGVDNTNATGELAGTGTITASGGVRIGARGSISGATKTTVGTLQINGDLVFSANGVLHADFSSTGAVDRIGVDGVVDITGALLDGNWISGSPTGPTNRYWLVDNDGTEGIIGTFANASLSSPSASLFPDAQGWVTFNGQEFAINYNGNYDTLAPVGGERRLPDGCAGAFVDATAGLGRGRGAGPPAARGRVRGADWETGHPGSQKLGAEQLDELRDPGELTLTATGSALTVTAGWDGKTCPTLPGLCFARG